jgi:hypothetical protein
MFSKLSVAVFSGVALFNVARITDIAVMLLDLGLLILSAVLHVA